MVAQIATTVYPVQIQNHEKGHCMIKKHIKGFTLIELLVVISILGVLAVLVISNVNEARSRARDVRKKDEMTQLKTALKLYYNDYFRYPAASGATCGVSAINSIKGCGTTGTSCCPVSGCPEFAAGGTGCTTVYMNKFPTGLGDNTIAYYSDGDEHFCVKTTLENASDTDMAKSYSACSSICTLSGITIKNTEYSVCSD